VTDRSVEESFTIGGQAVGRGRRARIELPIAEPYGTGSLTLPVQIVRGAQDGPRLFVSAAIHGDEINGVEIIRRLMRQRALRQLRGTLVALPVVNVYGFVSRSRYLPDRRDLNRSFPGSASGSLTARLAHLLMTEVVARCTHGVDLHTATIDRSNLPQVRCQLADEETRRLALAFAAPVVIDAQLRDGSLRQAVADLGIPMLVYEAGEALRFDEVAIRAGLRGVLRVMVELSMIPRGAVPGTKVEPIVVKRSRWVRAPASGVLRNRTALGARVEADQVLGMLSDPTGDGDLAVRSPCRGVVIGRTETPLMNEGDAAYHVAVLDDNAEAEDSVVTLQAELDPTEQPGLVGEPPIE